MLNQHAILIQIAKFPVYTSLKIPSPPTVYGAQLEIQRVVQNLLDNARRVSEFDQQITLEVEPLGVDQVKVSVRDKGPGITPQQKERLFHRFIQGRNRVGRAGLGLHLCRPIVEAHGGTIGVESSPGEGSTFWFILAALTSKPGEITETFCENIT